MTSLPCRARSGWRLPIGSDGSVTSDSHSARGSRLADSVAGCIEAVTCGRRWQACQDLNRTTRTTRTGGTSRATCCARRAPARRVAGDRSRAAARALRTGIRLHQAHVACSRPATWRARAAAVGDLAGPTARRRRAPRRDRHRCCTGVGDHAGALEHYSRPSNSIQRNAGVPLQPGRRARYLGDVDGAEQDFDAAIALRRTSTRRTTARAQLRRQTPDAQPRRPAARHDRAHARSPAGLVQLHLRAGEGTRGRRDYAARSRACERGRQAEAPLHAYDVDTDLRSSTGSARSTRPIASTVASRVATTRSRSSSSACRAPARRWSSASWQSSGASCAAGELNEFALELIAAHGVGAGRGPRLSRLDFVAATAQRRFQGARRGVPASACDRTRRGPRFIDKLPFNYPLRRA